MPPKQSWQVLRREKPSKEGMYYSVRAYDHCDQIGPLSGSPNFHILFKDNTVKLRFWNTTFAADQNFYFINHLDFGIHLMQTNWYSKIGVLLYLK